MGLFVYLQWELCASSLSSSRYPSRNILIWNRYRANFINRSTRPVSSGSLLLFLAKKTRRTSIRVARRKKLITGIWNFPDDLSRRNVSYRTAKFFDITIRLCNRKKYCTAEFSSIDLNLSVSKFKVNFEIIKVEVECDSCGWTYFIIHQNKKYLIRKKVKRDSSRIKNK